MPTQLRCKNCLHTVPATDVLRRVAADGMEAKSGPERLPLILTRLKCSKCGKRSVEVLPARASVKPDRKPGHYQKAGEKYVATENSKDLVFHRQQCGWMRNVAYGSELVFRDRESAIKRGYQPCRSCKPLAGFRQKERVDKESKAPDMEITKWQKAVKPKISGLRSN